MKQNIIVGNYVDDGAGDYLRRGGQKINSNFEELYSELGDGNRPHGAGYWKRYNTQGQTLSVKFGDAYTIDTTQGTISVQLPTGTISDYGRVIRLRDVNGTWAHNPVRVIPGGANTIKGSNAPYMLWRNFLDAELVFCAPGRWEYADNKLVTGVINSDASSVVRKEFIATQGQTDFSPVFDTTYNPDSTEVYKRGNLLYYGDGITADSDYGSMITATPVVSNLTLTSSTGGGFSGFLAGSYGSLGTAPKVQDTAVVQFNVENLTNKVYFRFSNGTRPLGGSVLVIKFNSVDYYLQYESVSSCYVITDAVLGAAVKANNTFAASVYKLSSLDGTSIRLREPCEAGDVITVVSYLDGIASYRTSFESYSIRVYDEKKALPTELSVPGKTWVGDLSKKTYFTLDDFDLIERSTFNPHAFEIILNGRQLTKAGTADLPAFGCAGAEADDEVECIAIGGAWVPTGGDFSVVQNENGRWRNFSIDQELEHGDIITIRWFNNDIGTLLDWSGDDGIEAKGDSRWMYIDTEITRTSKIEYSDFLNPSQKTVVAGTDEENIKIDTLHSLMMSVYPVGSLYMNAHNPANPADYMGFGTWIRFGQGRMPVSWNADDPNDPNFGMNNNDLDINGNPQHSSGGTGGSVSNVIGTENIPAMATNEKVLVADTNGDILIGGCQFDPDDEGPGFDRYREDTAKIRPGASANPLSVLPPYITVNIWVRVQ